MKAILVTGGMGFIASNFIKKLLKTGQYTIYNLDKMCIGSNYRNVNRHYSFELHSETETPNLHLHHFINGDICDRELVSRILHDYRIAVIYHFAAQSHVDRSFGNSLTFVQDNIVGTTTLLECAREYQDSTGQLEKFIHVSTDEVYGEVPDTISANRVLQYGLFNPTNPYAATKAAAEMMVRSFQLSYKLPIIITRSNNVYGPQQYWEKIIPKFIRLLMNEEQCTVYGAGQAMRRYLYIDDATDAYQLILEKGQIGQIYEMEADNEISALDMAKLIIKAIYPDDHPDRWIKYVKDRDFHDSRYIVNSTQLRQLGWQPKVSFESGFAKTVEWYRHYAVPMQYWEN